MASIASSAPFESAALDLAQTTFARVVRIDQSDLLTFSSRRRSADATDLGRSFASCRQAVNDHHVSGEDLVSVFPLTPVEVVWSGRT